ncbi:hypothetical protein [Streptomyces sp. NPDC047070]|uniref:hypothetical protein n=1 Tax=Streptomyces sp. NPDC047070 TaxID=3154923 RepID=UPI0034551CD7
MKTNRLHINASCDHAAAAAKARAAEGDWVMVSVYRGNQAGDAIARGIRTGRYTAYRPVGAFEAYVAPCDDGSAVWARALSDLWDTAPMPKTRTARVLDDDGQVTTVTVRETCPHCGGPRGPLRPRTVTRDGVRLVCDTWTNECGHVELRDDVLAEARRIADRIRHPQKRGPLIEGVKGGRYETAVNVLAGGLKKQPWLKAEASAQLLEKNCQFAAAAAAREFIVGNVAGWNTSGKAVALFLMDQDETAADGKGDSL